jgi:hypothetical protein
MNTSRPPIVLAALLLAALAAFSAAAQGAPLAYAVSGEWKASVFGDVGGSDKINSENFEISEKGPGVVFMRSSNDRGKIASSSEGIAFYYLELPASADFELSATASVSAFAKNNQASLGIMLRDKVFANAFVNSGMGSYLAVGPINGGSKTPLYAFRRTAAEGLVKEGEIKKSPAPAPDAVYKLSLKKSGKDYTLRMGEEEPIVLPNFSAFSGETLYLGLFTSRNAAVTFSEVSFAKARAIKDLEIDASLMKSSYRPGEAFDPSGLKVRAIYEPGEGGDASAELSSSQYAVLGFDSSKVGSFELKVSAGGASKTLPYTVRPLAISSIEPIFLPLKTSYRLGDAFDSTGLRVRAIYDEGYKAAELWGDSYELLLDGESAEGLILSQPGKALVTIASKEAPSVSASFEIETSPAALKGLSIARQPEKTSYLVGERFDATGLQVYAEYSDLSRDRLSPSEYEISGFDSSKSGACALKIRHKGAAATLYVGVRSRSFLGLKLLSRPKTSYEVGQGFDPKGLEVALTYDDGKDERLDPSRYRVDLSSIDFSKSGLYRARINLEGGASPALALPIAVRSGGPVEWKSIRFGQSTSDAKNYVETPSPGTARLVALEGGGKVTGDHDGITFYYVELDAAEDNFSLSADIKVIAYAKEPQDGQESFGIMARDALGKAGDSGIAASNLAAVGGYSGGTRSPNGTQLFLRSGVSSPSGAGSAGVKSLMLEPSKPEASNSYPAKPYRLTLSKTNSGFSARVNEGEEQSLWAPDLLTVQDGKMYVGFYVARLATIEVSNIKLELSSAAADPAALAPPPERIAPRLEILSSDKSPSADYRLALRTNAAGSLTVKNGTQTLVRDRRVEAGSELVVDAKLLEGKTTNLVAALLPDDEQALESAATVINAIAVTQRSYVPGGDILAAPNGSSGGDGTAASPLDLDTAVAFVREGQRIVLADGRYERYKSLVIPRYVDGKKGAEKALVAAEGARPILDFGKQSEGVVLSGDFWIVRGIDVTNSAPNTKGFTIGGDDNLIEGCRFYGNGDTGCQISRTDLLAAEMKDWPSRNTVKNCESFDNRDPSENNADGFAAKLTSGEGNAFIGCVSRNNIDDGWDLYTKAGTGAVGAVLIEGCVARDNGRLASGAVGKGDKNGFKLGGEGIAVPHVVRNCFAYGNGAAGFTANSNPAVRLERDFSLDNAGPNFSFATYAGASPAFSAIGLYSFKGAAGAADVAPPSAAGGFYFDGSASRDAQGKILSREDFDRELKEARLGAR